MRNASPELVTLHYLRINSSDHLPPMAIFPEPTPDCDQPQIVRIGSQLFEAGGFTNPETSVLFAIQKIFEYFNKDILSADVIIPFLLRFGIEGDEKGANVALRLLTKQQKLAINQAGDYILLDKNIPTNITFPKPKKLQTLPDGTLISCSAK